VLLNFIMRRIRCWKGINLKKTILVSLLFLLGISYTHNVYTIKINSIEISEDEDLKPPNVEDPLEVNVEKLI
jgi:hypothetical protein